MQATSGGGDDAGATDAGATDGATDVGGANGGAANGKPVSRKGNSRRTLPAKYPPRLGSAEAVVPGGTIVAGGGERMSNALTQLEAAGVDFAGLNEDQREVLSELSTEEIEMLTSLKERLELASDDLEPHAFLEKLKTLSGGALF